MLLGYAACCWLPFDERRVDINILPQNAESIKKGSSYDTLFPFLADDGGLCAGDRRNRF